jgi:hypothetical protein
VYKVVDGRMKKVSLGENPYSSERKQARGKIKKVKFADQQVIDFKQFVFDSVHKETFFNEGRKSWKDRVNREDKEGEKTTDAHKSMFSLSKENKFAEYSFTIKEKIPDESNKGNEDGSIDSSLKESNVKKYETKFVSRFEPIRAFHSIKDEYLNKIRKNVEDYASNLRSSCEKYTDDSENLKSSQISMNANNINDQILQNSSHQYKTNFETEESLVKKQMPFSTLQHQSVPNTSSKHSYSYLESSSHAPAKIKSQNESSDRIDTQSTNLEYEGRPQCKKPNLTMFVKRNDFGRDKKRYSTRSLKNHKKMDDRHGLRLKFQAQEFSKGLNERFMTFEVDQKEFDNHQLIQTKNSDDNYFSAIDYNS